MKATKNTGLDSKNILKSEEDEIVEYELRCAKKIILKKQPQMEREEIEQFLYRKGYSLEITKEAFEEV